VKLIVNLNYSLNHAYMKIKYIEKFHFSKILISKFFVSNVTSVFISLSFIFFNVWR